MTTRRKPSALRAALAGKTTRETFYDIPTAPSEKVDAIRDRLQEARRASLLASQADKAAAQKAVDDIAAELAACFHRLRFRGLPGDDDLGDLIDAFPPTEEQKAEYAAMSPEKKAKLGEPTVDVDSFLVAQMMACLVGGSELTAEEWREELWSERWSPADRNLLWQRVKDANVRPFGDGIPNE